MVGQERSGDVTGAKRRVGEQPAKEWKVGRDARHLGFRERRRQPIEGRLPRHVGRDELRDQGVVGETDLVPLRDARVDSNTRGQPQTLDAARLRQERPRILCVHARLDRMALRLNGVGREPLSSRDSQLLFDEVEARHGLRDRMLDLNPRVQLEEGELVVREEEFGRPGAAVADRLGECDADVWRLSRSSSGSRGAGASSTTFW